MQDVNIASVGGNRIENSAPTSIAAITDNVSHDLVAAPGAGLSIYTTGLLVMNAHASVQTLVTISDGTNSINIVAPPSGGGANPMIPIPSWKATANTKLTVICATTGANVYVTHFGYVGA